MAGDDDTKKINSWICISILRPYANVVSSFFSRKKKQTKKKRPKKKENEDFFFSFSSFKDRKGLE